MKITDIDHEIEEILKNKKLELDAKYLRARLKHCERGIPISYGWKQNWGSYIEKTLAQTKQELLASPSNLKNKGPIAPLRT